MVGVLTVTKGSRTGKNTRTDAEGGHKGVREFTMGVDWNPREKQTRVMGGGEVKEKPSTSVDGGSAERQFKKKCP